jgi:hypothetical protein
MDPIEIRNALQQVREVHSRVVVRQSFRGYSGYGRIAGGVVALLGAGVISSFGDGWSVNEVLWAWSIVCGIAVVINCIGVYRWWSRSYRRGLRVLTPMLDLVAPLFVGGVLSVACYNAGVPQLLIGIWACLFGVANIASRHCLTEHVWQIGWYYVFAGILHFLFASATSMFNPWPMGVTFFLGELYGGLVFLRYREEELE